MLACDIPIAYAKNSEDGYLEAINDVDCLKKPFRLGYRAPVFRVVEESNLIAVGFRLLLTEDGYYFNDQTVLPGFKSDALIAKFNRGQHEDTNGLMNDNGLSLNQFSPQKDILEPVIFLGSDEPANWGSWLYRILPKLIEFPDRDRIPVLVSQHGPWMPVLLRELFGVIKIIRHAPTLRYSLKHAFIPSQRNIGVYFDDVTLNFYRSFAEKIDGKSPYEKIYLSRQASARKKPQGRILMNEPELIDRIEGMGFKAIELETLPLLEQVRTIRDAKIIVAPGGSGLFNLVFALNAERVIDIEPNRTWEWAHHMLLRSCRIRHTILFGHQAAGAGAHGSWSAPIPAVIKAIS